MSEYKHFNLFQDTITSINLRPHLSLSKLPVAPVIDGARTKQIKTQV